MINIDILELSEGSSYIQISQRTRGTLTESAVRSLVQAVLNFNDLELTVLFKGTLWDFSN